MENLGIYIHIPFCEQKCNYCDFLSFTNYAGKQSEYILLLIKEIEMTAKKYKDREVDTIFFGGGTPSVMDGHEVSMIMNSLKNNFNISETAEISIEINPGTMTRKKAYAYFSSGINRASVGVQTLNDRLLKKIGRIHNKEQFLETINFLKEVGFKNINADIMFALPTQTIDDIRNTFSEIIKLELTHISFYSLIVEPNTPMEYFFKKYSNEFPDEELDRNMYYEGIQMMKDANYNQYEISNFALEGYGCRHNLKYWQLDEYVGLGMGSASYIDKNRYNNCYKFLEYKNMIEKNELPIVEVEPQTLKDDMSAFSFLGIRTNMGIDLLKFKEKFNRDFFEIFPNMKNHIESGLLLVEDNNLKATKRGFDILNQIEVDLVL